MTVGSPALPESNDPGGCHRTARSSDSTACTADPSRKGRDRSARVSPEARHRPRTVCTPVLTRVSDGNDLRRLDMTSKGGAVFGFDTLGHDTLHHRKLRSLVL